MFGFLLCLLVSVAEWFLVSLRTTAITRDSRWASLIVGVEVLLGVGAGYVIFVQQNLLAALGCALGASLGIELARKRRK